MKRINDRTVELTDHELHAHGLNDAYLQQGLGVPMAAKLALNRGTAEKGTAYSDAYAEYLSDGSVVRRGSRWHVKPEFQ